MPAEYRVRLATIADVAILVRHRILMFTEMGVPLDPAELDAAFRAWLVEDAAGAVARPSTNRWAMQNPQAR